MSNTKWCGKEKTVQSQVLGGAAIRCDGKEKGEHRKIWKNTHWKWERHSLMRGSSGR